MKAIKLTLLFLCISIITSCKFDKDSDCLPNTLSADSLEEIYNCADTRYGLEIDLQDNFTIIRNQTQFENLVTGNCSPLIDFYTYSLIIGKKALTSGNERIDYNYYYNCEAQGLFLDVIFIQNITTVAPNLTYHVLVPVIEVEDSIIVNITID